MSLVSRKLREPAWLVAATTLLLHLAAIRNYGFFRDELYYISCGKRLAWGYVDHPPFVALIARIERELFGESLVALRIAALLSAVALVPICAGLVRTFGGGRFAQALACLAVIISPYNLFVGCTYSMNSFEPIFWGGTALVVARAIGGARDRELLWVGPLTGLGCLNKLSMLWLCAGLLAGVALTPERRLLRKKELWIGAGIAALAFAPHLVWQAEHGFPVREFAANALDKNESYSLFGFIGQQIRLVHPVAAPWLFAGLVALTVSPALRRYRALGIGYLLVAGLIIAMRAKAYYLAPGATWCVAAGAVATERWVARRSVRAVLLAVVAAGGAVLAPLALPLLPVEMFQRYSAAIGLEIKTGEKVRAGALPQLYADMFGWRELADDVRAAIAELPPDPTRVILASNYGQASAIDVFEGAGLPPVLSPHNAWYNWAGDELDARSVVTVDFDADELAPFCAHWVELARHRHPLARPEEDDLPIMSCDELSRPLREVWPALKRYR